MNKDKIVNCNWNIVKDSFVSVLILSALLAGYIFYRINIVPIISEALQQDLKKYIGTIFVISISFIVQRFVGSVLTWYGQYVASKTTTEFDDNLIPLVRKTVKIVIWVIAFIVILPFYGVNISALIATLGVTSLAIALAAQDTIANIIAGFLIMVDIPFRIGDRIKLPSGEDVEVLDIGVRRSKFVSEDKKRVLIVPNLDLSKSKIVNYTYAEELIGTKD